MLRMSTVVSLTFQADISIASSNLITRNTGRFGLRRATRSRSNYTGASMVPGVRPTMADTLNNVGSSMKWGAVLAAALGAFALTLASAGMIGGILEAPPGFEPGMEVLQSGSGHLSPSLKINNL